MTSETLVSGVVVAHGELAEAFVSVVGRISGATDGLKAVSNEGLAADALRLKVAELVDSEATIIFVDLQGGSCGLASLGVAKDTQNVAVLSGVNLPMLLDFVFHRDLPLERLVERLVEKGRAELHSCAASRGSS